MSASYTSGQSSNPRRHPTCWASSQRSHTVSSTPCHGAWTSAPLCAHLSIENKCTAPQIKTPLLYPPHNNSSVYLTTTAYVWRSGQINNRMQHWWTTLQDSTFSSPTLAPIALEWSSQEQPGCGLTASALVSDISIPACTNGVRPPLWPVSVAQKNKPSTTLSSNVQCINLMDCMAWWFWTMRQSNGCSTSAPRSSAAKQWFEQLAQKKKNTVLIFHAPKEFASQTVNKSTNIWHGSWSHWWKY